MSPSLHIPPSLLPMVALISWHSSLALSILFLFYFADLLQLLLFSVANFLARSFGTNSKHITALALLQIYAAFFYLLFLFLLNKITLQSASAWAQVRLGCLQFE